MKYLVGGALSVCLLSWTASCDRVVDSSYQGEPQFTLDGSIWSQTFEQKGKTKLALLWLRPTLVHDPADATVLSELTYTTNFSLPVYAPPRAELLVDRSNGRQPDEPRVAVAYVVAYAPDVIDYLDRRTLLGISVDRAVVYVSAPVQPGSATEKFLHATPAAGFHVMKLVGRRSRPQSCYGREVENCADDRMELRPLESADAEDVRVHIPALRASVRVPAIDF
jgi:hypothetical protein